MPNVPNNPFVVTYEAGGNQITMDIDFVKRYLVRGDANKVSDQEVLFFLHTAASLHLNVLVNNECYLLKYGNAPAQLVIGKGAYMRRAYENPNYICMESGITAIRPNGEVVQKEGTCLYPNEQLIGGWCRVHYMRAGKEREKFTEVALAEYNKGQSNWRSMPSVMIEKCAVVAALRATFPTDFEGGYEQSELIASGVIPPEIEDFRAGGALNGGGAQASLPPAKEPFFYQPEKHGEGYIPPAVQEEVRAMEAYRAAQRAREQKGAPATPNDPPITQEQRQTLFSSIRSKIKDKDAGNTALKTMVEEEGYSSTEGMPQSAFQRIMERILSLEAVQVTAQTTPPAVEALLEDKPTEPAESTES